MGKASTCARCGAEYAYLGRGRPSTLCSTACKAAAKVEADKARYDRKRDDILAQKREYHVKNREAIREKDARYNAENRDKRSAYMKAWRARDVDAVRARDRERHIERRDYNLAAMRDRRWRMQERTDAELTEATLEAHPDGAKRCRSGHEADVSDFYRDRSRTDGLSLYCARHYQRTHRAVMRSEWDCTTCFYCGSSMDEFHVDHVVPVALGGEDDMRNYVPSCAPCNLSKNDAPVADWYMRKFGRAFDATRHPHGAWIAEQYPGLYPAA